MAVLAGDRLITANLGNSSVFLARGSKIHAANIVHDARNALETRRISRVCKESTRAQGKQHGCTRCLGMFDFKRPRCQEGDRHVQSAFHEDYFYAKPDIFVHTLSDEDDFVFFANPSFLSIFQTYQTVSQRSDSRRPSSNRNCPLGGLSRRSGTTSTGR